jgi:hypothetical protein
MGYSITRQIAGNMKALVNNVEGITNLELGRAIAAQAKLFAPVDFGQLRNSISASSVTADVLLNINPGKPGNALNTSGLRGSEVYVGANVEHAAPQEYGTQKTRAQPYLAPAIDVIVNKASAAEIFTRYNKQQADKELKRL